MSGIFPGLVVISTRVEDVNLEGCEGKFWEGLEEKVGGDGKPSGRVYVQSRFELLRGMKHCRT